MFPWPKPLMLISAIGQGVIFSLALTGAVRIICWSLGVPLSERVAGNLFLISSLVACSIGGFLYVRSLGHGQRKVPVRVIVDELA